MVMDMISKLKKINLHNRWKIDDNDIHNDIIHLYYEDEYYITIDGFYKNETHLDDYIKIFNRDITIQKIIE